MIIIQKAELINIKFNKQINEQAFLSKNLYNYANYIIRQEFFKTGRWVRYLEFEKICKENENYKLLPAQTSQNILRLLDKNWISFFKAIKDWGKHSEKYMSKPRIPKYKKKNGRNILIYPFQNLRIANNYINIPKTNFKFKIRDEISKKKIEQVRIIPQHSNYRIEIVYKSETIEINKEIKKILSIDLGLNNFVTTYNNLGLNPLIINGKVLKSINQYYNKEISILKSEMKVKNKKDWSKRLSIITLKRNNKIRDTLHKISKYIVKYCVNNNFDTIIIGYNEMWKQEINIGKRSNQNFVSIPYYQFINMIKYKSEEQSIKVLMTEESYTSKIDHLANEELKKQDNYLGKRINRGLFQSSIGKLVNADINGSLGIMRKVIGNELIYPIEAVVFQPIKINIF